MQRVDWIWFTYCNWLTPGWNDFEFGKWNRSCGRNQESSQFAYFLKQMRCEQITWEVNPGNKPGEWESERKLKKAKRGGICGCADLTGKSTQTFYGMKNSRHLFKFLPRTSHLGNNSTSLCFGQLCFLDQGARSGREMLGAVACVEVVCRSSQEWLPRAAGAPTVSSMHCANPSLFSRGRETPRGSLTSSKKVLVCSTISLK